MRILRLVCVFAGLGSCAATATTAAAFSGTPAALKLVRELRVAYRSVQAIDNVRSGDVFYCLSVPEGWDYVPHRGCRARARVAEEYDLSHGRIVRVIGKVTAPGLRTLRYVNSKQGWYRIAAGRSCWQRTELSFVDPLFVDFPFPNERLTIAQQSRSTLVLEGYSAPAGYREIDYIARGSKFEFRSDEISYLGRRAYRLVDHLRKAHVSTGPTTTPTCR